MGPWYYEVVSFDGDYVNLRRTDIESDELNPVALALLPPEIDVGMVVFPTRLVPVKTTERRIPLSVNRFIASWNANLL